MIDMFSFILFLIVLKNESFGMLQGSQPAKLSSGTVKLPWSASIDEQRNLPYMRMLEAQLKMLQKIGAFEISLDLFKAYRKNLLKKARIGNMQFQNEKFRKIRLTYFDGGQTVQVLFF